MFYTPAQVAQMLEMPASTLRYYAKRFQSYLSDQGGRKQRLYTDKDITVISFIRDLSAANVPLHLIEERLHIQPTGEHRSAEASLALVPTIAAEIASAQQLAHQAQLAAEHLKDQYVQQATTLAAITEQLAQQKEQLEKLEEWASGPWYKRLFVQRPK